MITYIPFEEAELQEASPEAAGRIGKAILGVAAAFIIPFAAPAIASAIGLSGAIGSTLVGAGLGAATSAVTGGNPLVGAVTGGLGGFAGAGRAIGATANAGKAGLDMSKAVSSAANAGKAADIAANTTMIGQTNALTSAGIASKAAGTIGGGISSAFNAGSNIMKATTELGVGAQTMAALRTVPLNVIKQAGGIGNVLALATRAAISGTQIDPNMAGLVEARRAELEQERTQNQELYNMRLNTAQRILSEANYFDPAEGGRRAALDTTQRIDQEAEATNRQLAAEQGYSTGGREQNKRRAGLAKGRAVSGAYMRGADAYQGMKINTTNSALPWLPTNAPGVSQGTQYYDQMDAANREARAREVGQFAGLFFGGQPYRPNEQEPWAQQGGWG